MKKTKKLILVLMSFALMFSLTGCLNKNIRNLSDSEIIKQIQVKMKEEMDKINFEVNFDDYEFKVNTGVEIQSNFGKVTIKDKRYNYDPITIYDGNFEVLEKEKIGIEPIIFVAHGYQNYVDQILLTDKNRGNNLEEALQISNGKIEGMDGLGHIGGGNGTQVGRVIDIRKKYEIIGRGDYYTIQNKISNEEYLNFFKGKKSNQLDYSDFVEKMNYLIIVIIEVKEEVTEELHAMMKQYYNEEYVLFILKKVA